MFNRTSHRLGFLGTLRIGTRWLARVLAVVVLALLGTASPPALGHAAGQPTAERTEWWREAVFYQIFVRSFADSRQGPTANDGRGDLRGLIERLDYLNDGRPETATDLGVTAIWLLPIHPSPSYHGYDVTDYRGVHPDYGTLEEFRELLAECRKRGIRVIIDLVLNHCSSRHPWFIEAQRPGSEKGEWFVWSATNPGWRGAWNQVVWHRLRTPTPGGPGPFYYGVFSPTMPDLNYRSEAVSAEMLDVARFWLEEVGVDGFRLDAVKFLVENGPRVEDQPETHAWLRRFRQVCRAARPDVFTVGEVWSPTEKVAAYVGDQLDACFEFDLASAIISAVNAGRATGLAAALEKTRRLMRPSQTATFLTNHDQERAMTQLGGDSARARLAASILLTIPGVPFIYYGEEIGMVGRKPDERLRTPMPWDAGAHAGFSAPDVRPWQALNPDWPRVNVAAQQRDPGSLLHHYRRLIALRRATPALTRGDYVQVSTGDDRVLAFLRRHFPAGAPAGTPPQTALVVVNLHPAPLLDVGVTLSTGDDGTRGMIRRAREVLNDADVAQPPPTGGGGTLTWRPLRRLEPRTAYVLLLER
jgi:alpha-amylase